MKFYIDDFVENLNYKKIIIYIGDVEPDDLRSKLEKDRMNHTNRFDSILENNLMFVENCDLQDVDTEHRDDFGNSLLYLISDGYVVYPLQYDGLTKRYFVDAIMN